MNERDRRHILERRALFVSSSLALLSCGPKPQADPPPGKNPDVTVPSQPNTITSASAAQTPPRPPARPPQPPAGEIPAGVSDIARQNYERLFSMIKDQNERLEKAENAVPDPCDPGQAGCEAKFREVADILLDYERSQHFGYFCPGSSEEAKNFAQTTEQMRQQVAERYQALTRRIRAAMKSNDPEKSWRDIQQKAYMAHPFPCLSIVCKDW